MTVPPQLTSSLLSFSYPASFRHLPPASSLGVRSAGLLEIFIDLMIIPNSDYLWGFSSSERMRMDLYRTKSGNRTIIRDLIWIIILNKNIYIYKYFFN